MRSVGFGTLEQRVNERSREDFTQYDIAANLDLGRLLPKEAALTIPVYAGISKTTSNPEFDPYDLDVKLRDKLREAPSDKRDSIRTDAVDERTIKTLNFTSVKRTKPFGEKPQLWDLSNIDINYNYTHERAHQSHHRVRRCKAHPCGHWLQFCPATQVCRALKKVFKSRSPWLALIRDFNFNYKPSLISVRADVFRQFGALRNRNVGSPAKLP
jgi:cell surface protein SprA